MEREAVVVAVAGEPEHPRRSQRCLLGIERDVEDAAAFHFDFDQRLAERAEICWDLGLPNLRLDLRTSTGPLLDA